MENLDQFDQEESPFEREVQELRTFVQDKEKFNQLVPEERQNRVGDNFRMFDRDDDGRINYEETIETLRSIDIELPEEVVTKLYDHLKSTEGEGGIILDDFFLFVVKKFEDDNKYGEMLKSFHRIEMNPLFTT
mmetsp:Transcript_146964/g.208374  ORF Transcript_146964/g.208374 Transcript_146964/m.208374 type:complete len:133 (+) Transcript_146964:60-458(+)